MLEFCLILWCLLSWQLARWSDRGRTGGLVLAYFIGFGLIHFFGALIYLETSAYLGKSDYTIEGFVLTTWGAAAFCAGVFVMHKLLELFGRKEKIQEPGVVHEKYVLDDRNAWVLYAVGMVAQLVILPAASNVATLSAILSGLSQLSIVGICLGAWIALQRKSSRRMLLWFLAAFAIPVVDVISSAFIGFAAYSLIAILAFLVCQGRVKLPMVPVVALGALLGLSVFVNYFENRSAYRELVWYKQVGIYERIEAITDTFLDFEFIDFDDKDHLKAIDGRLNQNHLVGRAKKNIDSGQKELAYGETLWFSIVGLIPRAIWPDKPAVGGGGDIVSRYTGLVFASSTSVGAGQVLEFYVNFGFQGVVFGFIVFGALLTFIDRKSASCIHRHDFGRFVLWYLPGIGFLQAGGNMVEITTTTVSSVLSALLIIRIAEGTRRRRRRATRIEDRNMALSR